MKENKLRWFGHVMREKTEAVGEVIKINVEGKIERSRPKKR